MSYSSARNSAQAAVNADTKQAIQHLAEAIRLLSRPVEQDIRKLEQEIRRLK
jgi:hypothetical protein